MDYQPVTSNDMIEQALAQAAQEPEPKQEAPTVVLPLDTVFDLPGGYVSPAGEVAYEAEVRELTGRDEEQIAKANSIPKAMTVVLSRGLVRVGDAPASEEVLNNMLAGDRDYVLLRVYAATFGADVEVTRYCVSCEKTQQMTVNLLSDIPVKQLEASHDRQMVIECSVGDVIVELPTGRTQKILMDASDRTIAEMSTILLANCVLAINGEDVYGPSQVLDLPIRDRRKINETIVEKSPGPQMSDIKVDCPECGAKTEVPLSLAGLFQI